MTRDELLWRMAEGAWRHHYCAIGATGEFCEHCLSQRASGGEVECFELSGGFNRKSGDDWRAAAEGALLAFEAATGINFGEKPATV